MNKLLYTSNTPFDMSDWEKIAIKSVYAGTGCIMAITDDGRVLQKTKDEAKSARTEFWTRIKQISISKWAEGLAIGLVEDGTCLIAKRAARFACEITKASFDALNATVRSWKDIVQVEVSDSFFALDCEGRVHCAALSSYSEKEYSEVSSWSEIKRIVTGTQNAIFGITADGRVMCAGRNVVSKYDKLDSFTDIVDVFPTGSECTELYLVHRDGTVTRYGREKLSDIECKESFSPKKYLDGTFCYSVYALTKDDEIKSVSGENSETLFGEEYSILTFAVGDENYSEPFLIATGQRR